MVFGKTVPVAKPTQLVNIPDGTIFTGNVSAVNPVRIDGELTGNLTTESSVALGETSRVKGDIVAGDVTIGGVVTGDIVSKGIVVVAAPGSLKGNVKGQGFSVEMGSMFSGMCEISSESAAYYLPAAEKDKPAKQG